MLRISTPEPHLARVTDWIDTLCVDDPRNDTFQTCKMDAFSGYQQRVYTDLFSSPPPPIDREITWHGKTEKSLPKPAHKSILQLKHVPGAPSAVAPSILPEIESKEVFARKVFVGGLPIDVSEDEISSTFSQFGRVLVDWPRRPDSASREGARHMTGYVFLVFEEEKSVQSLIRQCHHENGKYYLFVSSPTMRDKPVQVRPWRLSNMDYMLCPTMSMDPRRTVFIGGVPRPTRAHELAAVLSELYGTVCYVGIDIDPELKYPKGAARVTFTTTRAFVAAIHGRFVHIPHAETKKRVEIKPYVMDDQMCEECCGKSCSSRYAQYFCGDVSCLQYYCENCWDARHLTGPFAARRKEHKPLIRQGEQTKMLPRPLHHQNPTTISLNRISPTARGPARLIRD